MFQANIPPIFDTFQKPKNFTPSVDSTPCCMAMVCMFSDCAIMTTDINANPAGISYEIICATERIAPNMEYLLFEPQPAISMPRVSIATIAKM